MQTWWCQSSTKDSLTSPTSWIKVWLTGLTRRAPCPLPNPVPMSIFFHSPPGLPTSFPKWSFPYRLLHRLLILPGLPFLNVSSGFLVHSPRASQVVLVVKNLPANTGDGRDTGLIPALWEDLLEEGTTTHSSILVWRIPWTEEPGGLQSIGSHRVGHHWSNLACKHPFSWKFALNLLDWPVASSLSCSPLGLRSSWSWSCWVGLVFTCVPHYSGKGLKGLCLRFGIPGTLYVSPCT